jgi:molybdate transport system substrate-binding protein
MSPAGKIACVLLLIWVGLFALLPWPTPRPPVVVWAAASLRGPLTELAQRFEQQTGQSVELRFGGSETLLGQIQLSHDADLFIPADDTYLAKPRDLGWLTNTWPVARLHAVAIARSDQAERLRTWASLTAEPVRLAQANPDAAAIGQVTRAKLPAESWAVLQSRTVVFTATVTDVLSAVRLGTADVGIVWDAVAVSFPDVVAQPLPELAEVRATIVAARLRFARQPQAAEHFGQFLVGPVGRAVFRRLGFADAS